MALVEKFKTGAKVFVQKRVDQWVGSIVDKVQVPVERIIGYDEEGSEQSRRVYNGKNERDYKEHERCLYIGHYVTRAEQIGFGHRELSHILMKVKVGIC